MNSTAFRRKCCVRVASTRYSSSISRTWREANILEIHVCKRGRDPKKFDIPQLVDATKDFTGSEIEQAIVTGMIEAFADGEREFTTDEVVSGIKKTIPLIDTMQDKIVSIRQRAMQCTVSASKPHTDEPGAEAVADTKERPAQLVATSPTGRAAA